MLGGDPTAGSAEFVDPVEQQVLCLGWKVDEQTLGDPFGGLCGIEAVIPPILAKVDAGKGGTKFELSFTVRPKADRSVLGVRLNLSGRPFFGPLGSGVARAAKADLQQSLRRFAELYG